jgi:hypothetical protein
VTVAAAAVATAVTTTTKVVKKTQLELSPPTPRATPFFKRIIRSSFDLFVFHWNLPEKDSAWYW